MFSQKLSAQKISHEEARPPLDRGQRAETIGIDGFNYVKSIVSRAYPQQIRRE